MCPVVLSDDAATRRPLVRYTEREHSHKLSQSQSHLSASPREPIITGIRNESCHESLNLGKRELRRETQEKEKIAGGAGRHVPKIWQRQARHRPVPSSTPLGRSFLSVLFSKCRHYS